MRKSNTVGDKRQCSICKELKDFSEFEFMRSLNRYRPRCKVCELKYRAEYRNRTREHINEYGRSHNYKYKDVVRESKYKSKFGITLKDYNDILASQGGVCATCGKPPNRKALSVDHDHRTGKVRGLLCQDCNFALGHVKDNPTILERLIDYLRSR
jgi:hypothetical protein